MTSIAAKTCEASTLPIPSAFDLDAAGRLFLLTWLAADLSCGVPVTVSSWRAAWGRAADYQMVRDGRAVLA